MSRRPLKFEIEIWTIDRPQPYGRNPRRISEKAIAKVAGSIREFGFQKPIVVDEKGVILAGHTTLRAAESLKLPNVPVKIARGLTDKQKRAYRIADNRVAEETNFDNELLAGELADLLALDFNLGPIGFDDAELKKLLGTPDTSPQLGEGFIYRVVIDCKDEADQNAIMAKLEKLKIKCRPSIS